MIPHDPDPAAALDAALDRLVAGDAPDADADDTTAAARRLHDLHAAHSRTPDPRFVTSLEERLMSMSHALPSATSGRTPITASRPTPTQLGRKRVGVSRTLSAAAIALMLVGASYAAIDNRPSGSPTPAAALLAPESGTPAAPAGETAQPILLWEQATPDFDPAGFGGMVWHGDAIYRLRTADGVTAVEAFDAATGDVRWQAFDAVVPGPGLVVDDAGVVVAADPVTVVSLDPATGAEQWRVALDEPIAAITGGDGHVGATTYTGRVSVMDATTGAVVWTNATGNAPAVGAPAFVSGYAVILGADGSVVSYNLATAAPAWTVTGIDPGATQVQVGAAGVLVATGDSVNGVVIATSHDPATGMVIGQATVPGSLLPIGIAGGPIMISQAVVDPTGVVAVTGVAIAGEGVIDCGVAADGAVVVEGGATVGGDAVVTGTIEAGAVAVSGASVPGNGEGVISVATSGDGAVTVCGAMVAGGGTIDGGQSAVVGATNAGGVVVSGGTVGSAAGDGSFGIAGGSGTVAFGGDTLLIDGSPVAMPDAIVTIDADTGLVTTEGVATAIPGDILALASNPADATMVVVTRLDGMLAAYRVQ